MNRRDPGFDVWVVVADVLVAFLCVVFFLFVVQAGPKGQSPPEAVERFVGEMNELKARRGAKFDVRRGFSNVQLEYQEKLLFGTCDWEISPDGRQLLNQHFLVFQRYAAAISRVQIEGHADSRSAGSCPRLQRAGMRRDNWNLSSFRALEVRQFLEEKVLDAGRQEARSEPGKDPATLLKALEAVGRGDLHPRDAAHPENPINRRIEITVHFREMTGS